jgi:uncharacterized membrane protein
VRIACAMLGFGLVLRSSTNLSTRRLTGIGAGMRAIDVEKTIHIDAPVETVFGILDDPEGFPRFMRDVDEVKRNADGSYHWRVHGPIGLGMEWDSLLTERIPNRLIAWTTKEGRGMKSTGKIQFETSDDARTIMHVKLSYNPPLGAIGHTLATVLGVDPHHRMDDDLLRLKTLVERTATRVSA